MLFAAATLLNSTTAFLLLLWSSWRSRVDRAVARFLLLWVAWLNSTTTVFLWIGGRFGARRQWVYFRAFCATFFGGAAFTAGHRGSSHFGHPGFHAHTGFGSHAGITLCSLFAAEGFEFRGHRSSDFLFLLGKGFAIERREGEKASHSYCAGQKQFFIHRWWKNFGE